MRRKKKNSKKIEKADEENKEKETAGLEKKEKKSQNKILKIVLISCVVVIALVSLAMIISDSSKKFVYKGVEFNVVDFCDSKPCLRTYNTKVPVFYQGKRANYNFYLHKNPEKTINNVLFEGNFSFREEMVVKISFDKSCDGFEQVAVANFLNLHGISGMKISGNGSEECNPFDGKMYVEIKEANRTYIEQFGPSCYNINIKDCEILEGTERFMIESFAEIKKLT